MYSMTALNWCISNDAVQMAASLSVKNDAPNLNVAEENGMSYLQAQSNAAVDQVDVNESCSTVESQSEISNLDVSPKPNEITAELFSSTMADLDELDILKDIENDTPIEKVKDKLASKRPADNPEKNSNLLKNAAVDQVDVNENAEKGLEITEISCSTVESQSELSNTDVSPKTNEIPAKLIRVTLGKLDQLNISEYIDNNIPIDKLCADFTAKPPEGNPEQHANILTQATATVAPESGSLYGGGDNIINDSWAYTAFYYASTF